MATHFQPLLFVSFLKLQTVHVTSSMEYLNFFCVCFSKKLKAGEHVSYTFQQLQGCLYFMLLTYVVVKKVETVLLPGGNTLHR